MPVAFLTVKCVDNSLIHLDVDLKTLVEEFRSIIAPKCGIPKQRQKLVFAGRLLQDGRTLEAYGIERNSTIHLLTGGRGGGGEEHPDMRLPPQLGALQRHVLQNPDILQQMLESPAMQSLLNDFDFMRGVLKTDPRTYKMLDGLPELQQMLQDSEFMQQAAEAMRNPVHVRDVLRSTDRAATQLESLAGGSMDVLRLMCEDVRRPTRDQQTLHSTLTGTLGAQGDGSGHPGGEQDLEDIHEGNVRPPPEWLGKFDTNAMASMMQDQNMQQLMSQLVQSMPGPSGPLKKPHPDDPFLDPSFVGQMFQAQTLTSMTMLQQAVEQLSMTAAYDPDGTGSVASPGATGKDFARDSKDGGSKGLRKTRAARYGAEEAPAHDSPQVLSGLNPKSPAANFKESFSLFLQAEQDSPDVRFRSQLQAMANMGFTDKEVCIQALHAHDGNMNRAVESLVAGQVDK